MSLGSFIPTVDAVISSAASLFGLTATTATEEVMVESVFNATTQSAIPTAFDILTNATAYVAPEVVVPSTALAIVNDTLISNATLVCETIASNATSTALTLVDAAIDEAGSSMGFYGAIAGGLATVGGLSIAAYRKYNQTSATTAEGKVEGKVEDKALTTQFTNQQSAAAKTEAPTAEPQSPSTQAQFVKNLY